MSQKLAAAAATAGAILAASASFAADMPVKAPVYAPPAIFSWNGCYVGASGGFLKPSSSDVPIGGDPALQLSQTLGNVPLSISPSGDGYLVGGQVGCNRQMDRIVYGFETNLSYTDADRSVSVTQGPNVVTTAFSDRLRYLGTFRLRLGLAADRALFYATGGLAYGSVEASARAGDAAGTSVVAGSHSDTRIGYTVGGGIEYAFTNNWSLKGEYLYYDMGKDTLTINAVVGPPETATFTYRTSGQLFRGGLNFRF